MKWFLNLGTGAKLVIGFGLVIILLAIAIWTSYNGITAVQRSQTRLFELEHPNAVDLAVVESNLNRGRTDVLAVLLGINVATQQAQLADIASQKSENEKLLRRLRQRNSDNAEFLRELESFMVIREEFNRVRDEQTIPLHLEGKTEEAKALQPAQNERYLKIRTIIDEMIQSEERQAQNAVTNATRLAADSVRTTVIVGVMAFVLAIVMVLFLNAVIAKPLRHISQAAARVADGDLTGTVAVADRTDEVGALAAVFRKMIENLRGQLKETSEGINLLGSSATEISASTSQFASGATETATAISQTTTTMEEVRQTAEIANQKARQVAEIAQKTMLVSEAGKKATSETVAGINRIREQMESIAESMVQLSEQSRSISDIIATVDDLAQQSNLLAVNASIEAAKAGEQGKGFAVVAQEVRSLSDQSKQATTQVRAILNDIQKATNAAVMATEQGGKAVEAGVKQSAEAGQAIQELATRIAESAQAAAQIAASSQQQQVGMEQVSTAMESVKTASSQNVESAKQLETAARNLKDLGQKLQRFVERYKV